MFSFNNNPMMMTSGTVMRPPSELFPNYGLGPNDSMGMFNSMLNIFNNNSFINNPNISSTGYFPGMRTQAPSPFIFEDGFRNNNFNLNNFNPMIMPPPPMNGMPPMNFFMNFNMFMNNMNNLTIRNTFDDENNLDKKDIKRNESLDVKMDVDNLLKLNKNEIDNKNNNIQYILNYIPFTIIKDVPEKKGDEPHCLVCLCDFQVGEKVSALPCFHCFHTKCIDEWIIRSPKCPICKFEITLKNLIGEDIIKEHLKLIEKAKIEEEKKEKERKEKERLEKEKKEREKKEKERLERERKAKERQERLKKENEKKKKELEERLEKQRKEREQKKKEKEEKDLSLKITALKFKNVKKVTQPKKKK